MDGIQNGFVLHSIIENFYYFQFKNIVTLQWASPCIKLLGYSLGQSSRSASKDGSEYPWLMIQVAKLSFTESCTVCRYEPSVEMPNSLWCPFLGHDASLVGVLFQRVEVGFLILLLLACSLEERYYFQALASYWGNIARWPHLLWCSLLTFLNSHGGIYTMDWLTASIFFLQQSLSFTCKWDEFY